MYLNGINHKTVSEQCSFIFIFYLSLAHVTSFLKYRLIKKYCKSSNNMSISLPIAERLE